MDKEHPRGPLSGFRIVELGGIGPTPFAGMLFSDMGAEVIRVDRPEGRASVSVDNARNLMLRGRRSIVLDLNRPESVEAVLRLISGADAAIEGFRPGVLERLHVGPTDCMRRNPKLVYGRVTGWGQSGPLAQFPGHDINYIAVTGILDAIGYPDRTPVPPLNLVGDFGGGGMLLAFGVLCALLEARSSGKGQVVDAAMADGAALLTTSIYSLLGSGQWIDGRRSNVMDGGAPFYNVYETADHKFVAVGAVEERFYKVLLEKLGIDPKLVPDQMDRGTWPSTTNQFAAIFRMKSRDQWIAVFEGSEACVSPVVSFAEVNSVAHNRDRASYHVVDGMLQPAPAPRFDRTPGNIKHGPRALGADTADILLELGFSEQEAAELSRRSTPAENLADQQA